MIPRTRLLNRLNSALRRNPAVSLLGPRQSGKTTLARALLTPDSENYFDLERPTSLRRLEDPETSLGELRGLVVIDEVQRRPELFPILRVLIDRPRSPARFLLLGSASPALLRQSSESLAGRIEVIETAGFSVEEVGLKHSTLASRRISSIVYCEFRAAQLHVARGVHTYLSRAGVAAAGHSHSKSTTPPLLDHARSLPRPDLERCRACGIARAVAANGAQLSGFDDECVHDQTVTALA